nr:retrotransposon protein, putative, Ty1-copia subclass [Tanacetum cinerariifolium]
MGFLGQDGFEASEAVQAVEAWKYSDFLCHNYVLNGLVDDLYNMYCKTTTAKELWESLEHKYKTEDAGHHAANCKMPKWVNLRQAHMVNDNMDMIAMVSDVTAMISEVNLSDKFVLSKNQMHVSTGYAVNGMFMLNVMVFKNDINKVNSSAYLIEFSNVWHYRLGHGCLAKVVMPTPKAQKIRSKSVDCIFIRYAKNSGAYHFIVHDSKNLDIQKNAVMESRNASFFENIFPCLMKEAGSSSRLDEEVVQDKRQRDDSDLHDERQDQLEEEEVEPRRSKRARTEKSFGPDFVSFMVENEPTSYREAVASSEGNQWKEAIKSEIDSILENHTWELVDLPPGCKPLGYKWIFKKKKKADGTIDKYKAILVIKGFRQREGLDYFDTYSPVTNDKMIKSTKDMLKSKFDMKDMGLVDVILDIKIIRTHNRLVLSQAHYVDKILNTHNARDSSLARTPIDTSLHLSKNRGVGVA